MLKDLVAIIKHACVEVTHALRAITGGIAVMNLYQMVLYGKAVKVSDRDCNGTDMFDNNVEFSYFGNTDTLSILKKD